MAAVVGVTGLGFSLIVSAVPDPPPFSPVDAGFPAVSPGITSTIAGPPREVGGAGPSASEAVLVPPAGRPAGQGAKPSREVRRIPGPHSRLPGPHHRISDPRSWFPGPRRRIPGPLSRPPGPRPRISGSLSRPSAAPTPARPHPGQAGSSPGRPDPCAAFDDFRRAYCRAVLDELANR
ncbi:hypothetical protein AB0395_16150 [Streptosporangium sp. NPDC051023]|uniref:hypothetical protein n=1 Tax=Streptosporangium sp. NPDC051023 TaxID=3155410 RepID=UPI00344F0AFF